MTLPAFLDSWDASVRASHAEIDLFNPEKTAGWSQSQKQRFVHLFYHARAHFVHFLWFMGNFAPTEAVKNMILANIAEEFGGLGPSHEQLYLVFAKAVGVDLSRTIRRNAYYVPFLRDFNAAHLEWLYNHSWPSNLAAFAAYERLDNVDYEDLYRLALSFGVTGPALGFFMVHRHIQHFKVAETVGLHDIWDTNPESVREAFSFIADNQEKMWRELSEAIEFTR